MEKILVWVKEPEKTPKHVWVSNSLENLQKIVGGYIECYFLSPEEAIICNEEGRINGECQYNCYAEGNDFYGPIIFAGVGGEEFKCSNLTKEQINKIIKEEF